MIKLIYRLLTQKIYPAPYREAEGDLPQYLSLREVADLPPHHPCSERRTRAGSSR